MVLNGNKICATPVTLGPELTWGLCLNMNNNSIRLYFWMICFVLLYHCIIKYSRAVFRLFFCCKAYLGALHGVNQFWIRKAAWRRCQKVNPPTQTFLCHGQMDSGLLLWIRIRHWPRRSGSGKTPVLSGLALCMLRDQAVGSALSLWIDTELLFTQQAFGVKGLKAWLVKHALLGNPACRLLSRQRNWDEVQETG